MRTEWNLKYLYKDKKSWEKDYNLVKEKLQKLDLLKNEFIDNIEKFKEFITLKISVIVLIEKLYCYARRHLDIDSTLEEYSKLLKKALDLYNSMQLINNYFEQMIVNNPNKVEEYLKDDTLNKYKRYIYLILRRKEHIIDSKDAQDIYPKYKKDMETLKTDYQDLFTNKISFNDVKLNGTKVNVNRETYNDLIIDKNQNTRKTVYDIYTSTFANVSDILGNMYIKKLSLDLMVSREEKYHSLLSKKLFELELPDEILDELISKVNKNLHVMHEYTDLRKQLSGLKKFHVYDSSISLCKIPKIEYELIDAINIIKSSLSILGNAYISIIDKMFDEGWVDVYSKASKRTMSFTCISYIGVPYILINYNKSINSVRTLAHEIGHAIHAYYSKNNNEFEYFEFSYFLTEIASKVNEILFNEYMIRNCNDIEEKKYILNNIISSIGNSIFGQTMLTEFEHTIIKHLESNENINTNYLNDLYLELNKKYNGKSLTVDDNIKYGWSKIPHFIMQDTYYIYQYSIGTSIAVYIAYKILNNENNMKEKYLKFLKLGNSVSIEDSLKVIDVDLKTGKYIEDAIQVLSKKINEMKNL